MVRKTLEAEFGLTSETRYMVHVYWTYEKHTDQLISKIYCPFHDSVSEKHFSLVFEEVGFQGKIMLRHQIMYP